MSSTDDFVTAVQALAAALLAAITDPADSVRILAALADFHPNAPVPSWPVGDQMAVMQDASGDLFRRAAVVALARASSAYQPASSDDAAAVRGLVAGLLDDEILVAGDQGEDATYNALRALRAAVVQDLTKRAAGLPGIRDFAVQASLPAPVLAQRIYRDPSRGDELALQANPPHPAFMPVKFKGLAR